MKKLSFSSATLKLIALGTMLIDHVGLLFFPGDPLWRAVGRVSFPLFAFLVAEGFRRTSNVNRYFFRLCVFAVISQIPYALVRHAAGSPPALNIFFTLAAGLLALVLLSRLPVRYGVPCAILICVAAEVLSFDYGAYGVLTILSSAVFIKHRRSGIALLSAIPLADTIVRFLSGVLSIQIYAVLSVPLIALYNGEHGINLPRRLLYWFYPVHLLLLWLIWSFRVV